MAPFNPSIPDQPGQELGGNSRPVDVPNSVRPQGVATNTIMPEGVKQGNMAAQYAGEAVAAGDKAQGVQYDALGDIFKEAVSGVDFLAKAGVTMVKKDIEDKVYQVADKERQAYTDVLEKIKQGVGVKNVLDANASDDDAAPTPSDVANLPSTLEALQSAKDSGKISGSYYQSRLLAEAKSLRSQYPGFREEIDQQFSKVTGTNPANAYITSLVQDINRAQAASSSNKNKMLTYIRSNLQFPGAEEKYQQYFNGDIADSDIIKWAAPYEQQKYQLNMRSLQFADKNNTRQDQERIAGDSVDYAAGVTVNRAVDSFMTKMGLNTAQDVDKMQAAQNAGTIPATQWQQWGQQVANAKTTLRTQMIADADKQGYTQAAGGKAAVIKKIDDSLQPMDSLLDRVYGKDFGGIYNTQKQLTAQNDQTKQGLLNDPKVGPYFQTSQALKDIGGEQNLQQFGLNAIKGNFNDDFKGYFSKQQQEMATQWTMKTSGVPYTFNDTIDHLQANKVNDIGLNKAILGTVKQIADPKTPDAVKENYAMAAFSPGNRGMISKLVADGFDKKGNQIDGQNKVFQDFTSPEMTKSMYQLGKKNPQIWEQYQNWTKETLANELMPQEIQDLKNIPDNSGVSVGWDAANHRFQTIDTRNAEARFYQNRYAGNTQAQGANSYYNIVDRSVNKMNANLSNFKHVAEASGQDVDAFVLHTIADAAGPEALRNVNGIPHNIIRDMGLAKYQNQQSNFK